MSIESASRHEQLSYRNKVQVEALKLFLGDRFSDKSFEDWLLHYADDLHEIVSESGISEQMKDTNGNQTEFAELIAQKLKEKNLGLAA